QMHPLYTRVGLRWKMTSALLELKNLNQKPNRFSNTPHKEDGKYGVFVEPPALGIKTPLKASTSHSVLAESQQDMGSLTTPTKGKDTPACEPWTPTANLKILISAVSPEIRNREKELCIDDTEGAGAIDSSQEHFGDDSDKLQTSRKEKSLGLLCHKFLARYPDYPNSALNNDICLDEVAGELHVERRRIYDIVNVLESLHMVSRLAKNRYTWHGRGKLAQTLGMLKQVGEEHGYSAQMQQLKQRSHEREFDSDAEEKENEDVRQAGGLDGDVGQREMFFVELPGMEFRAASVNSRKDKSLRVMSQKFVMLFLVSKPRVVSLDIAAKILIGEDQVIDLDKSKFKTKIRRLYDIANVLSSLELIKKVHVTEERGRKPAFKWTGPEDFLCVKDEKTSSAATLATSKTLESRSSIENCAKNLFPSSKTKHSFTRHPSLVKLAKSIQDDRRKINSAPSSPVKMKKDSTDPECYPSRMAQLAAICKIQLDEQSRKSKKKPKQTVTQAQKQKGKATKTSGAVEQLVNGEQQDTNSQAKTLAPSTRAVPYLHCQYSPLIPVILPQNQTAGPCAIYVHSCARPVANRSSLAVRSMRFEDKEIHCDRTASASDPENDSSQKNCQSPCSLNSPKRVYKRACTEKLENSSPKRKKTQTNSRGSSPGEAELYELYLDKLKARRGLVPNRPSPRALHLDPEFINTPENKGSEQLDESVETFLEKEEKLSCSDSEAGLTPIRSVSVPEIMVPSGHLHPEALVPAGYLIPISQQSLFSLQRSRSPGGESPKPSASHHKAYQPPVTGALPVMSSELTPTSFTSHVINQSSPSFASGQHVNSPSPAILNFTLQNLGLISAGIPQGASPGTVATPLEQASPVPGHLSFQPGGMIFIKPMSPVPVQPQMPGQHVTLISLQQPLLATPKASQCAQQSFFHTPVSTLSPLAAVVSSSHSSHENIYIPQRKLEVSTEET
uniref:Transcription factor E2F8 n=1 Tax=Lepisosteus oculatus TaxID=7918 RepID=W5MBP2_LEPOC